MADSVSVRERDRAAAEHRRFAESRHYMAQCVDAFADGCAHRDAQVIAYLEEIINMPVDERPPLYDIFEAIVRREHVK